MRLLRRTGDGSFALTDNLTDNIPKYAILSHTWLADEDETTYDDLRDGKKRSRASLTKIQFCVDQAHKDGLEYSWIDTCCIDRSSSAELQEAITTMFSWYQNAERCYVYLRDVSASLEADQYASSALWKQSFYMSRWFTRGWTLQELLAPGSVEFFSVQGTRLGDKRSLEEYIYEITKIPIEALRGRALTKFTVAERLSWAENRDTRRREDKAYSLLGLFGIFMPLLYGEGDNALRRLKQEIERVHSEHARFNLLLASIPTVSQAAFDSIENQHEPTCLPNTRLELLQEINGWIEGPHKRCIFWLNGIAGTGKSTVARTVAEAAHGRGHLGASFFFSRGGGESAHADRLFTSIAWQLASKIPHLKQFICEAIEAQDNIAATSLRYQWDHLILGPLTRLEAGSSPSTIVIVIDALDECDSERDIRIIIRLLATTKALQATRLRVFITSRPDIPVRCGFSQIPEFERQTFVLHDISPAVVDRDLRLFFENSFEAIRAERGFAIDWPGMRALKCLIEISGGLFIWASTACRYIREGRRLALRRIDSLINGQSRGLGPEKRLDEIYTTVLRNAVAQGYSLEEKLELCGMLRDTLGSIAILQAPLSLISLANLLRQPPSEISETLADMHTVLNIPDQKHRPIRLHHPSFRDYLLNQDRCSDHDFWVDEKGTHKIIADCCVELMSRSLKRNICSLSSPGVRTEDIRPGLIESCIPPELQYACLYWVHHYRESGSQLCDGDRAHVFYEDHFLSWLEVISLTGNMAEAAAIVRMYASLLTPSQNLRQLPLVQDSRRLLFAFQSIIEQAPLQAYCAALAFSPKNNKLRERSMKHLQNWVHRVHVVDPKASVNRRPTSSRTFFVNDLAFTPDGQHLISGSVDEFVRLWEVGTKSKLGKLLGHTDKISSVAVSPDGLAVASASDDTTVIVWDFRKKTVRYKLTGHSRWVNSVTFSRDGALLASGSMDETVRIWNVANGKEIHVLGRRSSCINSVAFSPDGSLVASGAADRMVRLWDVAKGDISMLLDGHSGAVNCVQFSSEGDKIVSAADDMTIKLWDAKMGIEYLTLKGHQRRVMTVAFSPTDKFVASGSEDSTVRLWDSHHGDLLAVFRGHTSGINAVAFSPIGYLLASSSFDGEVRLWDTKVVEPYGSLNDFSEEAMPPQHEGSEAFPLLQPSVEAEVHGHTSIVTCLTISRDGLLVASGSHDATIKLWTRDGSERFLLEGHMGSVNCLVFSSDSQVIASSSADGTIRVWDTTCGKLWHTLEGHTNSVRLCRFSSDDQYLASCSTDTTAILWDVGTGSMLNRLEGHSDTVNDIKFLPTDNQTIATCSADRTVKLWDVPAGVVRHTLRGHSDAVNHIGFSPDGQTVVSCSADKTIRLWNLNGTMKIMMKYHELPFNVVAISPDGKAVASCAGEGSVTMWNLENRSAYSTLELPVVIRTVSFSTCGRYIETDRGVLDTGLFFGRACLASSGVAPTLFATEAWVKRGSEDILWLPHEYHASSVAAAAGFIVLGHDRGGISFLHF